MQNRWINSLYCITSGNSGKRHLAGAVSTFFPITSKLPKNVVATEF